MTREMSLRNIDEFSNQEIFDFVSEKLLDQGKRSVFPNPHISGGIRCSYHNEACDMNGPKCAVGHILSEEEHRLVDERKLNGSGVGGLIEQFGYNDFVSLEKRRFLTLLQDAHDTSGTYVGTETSELFRKNFVIRMRELARKYDLSTTKLDLRAKEILGEAV